MKWRKLGFIYNSSGENYSMHSHAAVPVADLIEGDIYKIYFTSRDKLNRSYINYVIIDLKQPKKIIDVSKDPILTPGCIGEFDDSGVMSSWIVNDRKEKYFYYIGWNLGTTVPFRNSIGLAKSTDKSNFKKLYKGPIVDRSMTEPHFVASSCVIKDKDLWRMWYLSCTEWCKNDDYVYHKYHIKYAESDDGIYWKRDGTIAIDFKDENEYAISRPCVIKDDDLWRMWYSYRGSHYLIGYAESVDGKKWIRKDNEVGISISNRRNSWDSEMIEYPFVFIHKGELYMLYNGNGFGLTGFGIAKLED